MEDEVHDHAIRAEADTPETIADSALKNILDIGLPG